MTDFFPTDLENRAYDEWKARALDATSHGELPSDTYLLQVYVEGTLSADQVAIEADWDYEELSYREGDY